MQRAPAIVRGGPRRPAKRRSGRVAFVGAAWSSALPVECAVPGSVSVGERVAHSTKRVLIDAQRGVAGDRAGTERKSVRDALERPNGLGSQGG